MFVDYDPLPAIVDPEVAARNEMLLFPDAGTNVAMAMPGEFSDDFFAGCEVVVSQRMVSQRVAPCPLEVRSGAAMWGADGRITQYASTRRRTGPRAPSPVSTASRPLRSGSWPPMSAAVSGPRSACTSRT